MTAILPEPRPLIGSLVRLDPLEAADAAELFDAIVRPDVYEFGYGGGVAAMPADAAAFESSLPQRFPFATGIPFTVRIAAGPLEDHVLGTTSLGDLDTVNRGAHIGWTAYHPAAWGTGVNAECKLLLLDLAFGSGFERVKIQTDAVNARSRAAIAKLGASFEGVLRHHRLRADGTWRDTAVYSILAEEWPALREPLRARVDAIPAPLIIR
ncbi:Protein N-acetyltransferase, RimJ/RimL family [Paramicrobacterium humi]|uniref:Protein N-acetyltransferase, RimJ/RimL family n=1 Tax=Paramicrobacterium humi TaxID=640635 RepID=A0A1H4MD59_9MICO|nr:GNAT family protein [Microbacterium humi]SEB80272.1 Protein N-acetyltransferase, RimJ/RimL family [Microbacterium humi]